MSLEEGYLWLIIDSWPWIFYYVGPGCHQTSLFLVILLLYMDVDQDAHLDGLVLSHICICVYIYIYIYTWANIFKLIDKDGENEPTQDWPV